MESIKIGIIGCGDIATYHARLIRGSKPPNSSSEEANRGSPIRHLLRKGKRFLYRRREQAQTPRSIPGIEGVEIVAASDINPERLSRFCEAFAVQDGYANYKELLARKDLDAVLICTPTHTHAAIAIEAARHRKHIFCEKPMAMTSEDCERMVEATSEAGVVLQIGYVLRFSSERGRIKEAIENGEIGRPVFWREIYNPRGGPVQKWVHDKKLGGGIVWENSHTLDFLCYVFGDPETVMAIGGRYKPENTTAQDTIGVLLVFPGGDKALFTDSYALAGFGWGKTACRPTLLQIDIIGPQGFIQYPDSDLSQKLTIGRYTSSGQDIEKQRWSSDWGANGYRQELEHFFQCVREGNSPACPGEEGLRTIQLAETVLRSIQKGEVCRFQ